MKYIYVNLKRFDILRSLGGVNDLPVEDKQNWAEYIFGQLNKSLNKYSKIDYKFVFYLPEAYLISAMKSVSYDSPIKIGCQSIYSSDVIGNSNIGAFTTYRPASSMISLGVKNTIIGHSEERKGKIQFLKKISDNDKEINHIVSSELQDEIQNAQKCDMDVLYCIGEDLDARENGTWRDVIRQQLNFDSDKVNINKIKIAYEPIWAIGPNRPVPDVASIEEVAKYVHQLIGAKVPVIYGGGLKDSNARDIAQISDIDGGLIALTNFSGHVGFYPHQYLSIIEKYIEGVKEND